MLYDIQEVTDSSREDHCILDRIASGEIIRGGYEGSRTHGLSYLV